MPAQRIYPVLADVKGHRPEARIAGTEVEAGAVFGCSTPTVTLTLAASSSSCSL